MWTDLHNLPLCPLCNCNETTDNMNHGNKTENINLRHLSGSPNILILASLVFYNSTSLMTHSAL